jgi:hypothetical protein
MFGVLTIPPLPPSTILLVEVGSTAHGTGLPGGEDHDEMGVELLTDRKRIERWVVRAHLEAWHEI